MNNWMIAVGIHKVSLRSSSQPIQILVNKFDVFIRNCGMDQCRGDAHINDILLLEPSKVSPFYVDCFSVS